MLVNELLNLRHDDSGGNIKIIRGSGVRKDRYSSLSYSHWVACQLENKIKRRDDRSESKADRFLFRAPKIK